MIRNVVAPLLLSSVVIVGCGSRGRGRGDANGQGDLLACGTVCADPSECQSGSCVAGVCACDNGPGPDGAACDDASDCTGNEYCRYDSVSPWVAGTDGHCSAPCTSSCPLSNGFFQTCHDGRCYTEIDCTPGGAATQCPPGEVCNAQAHTCTAPPDNCYFNEQCPVGWVCDTSNTCLDPNDIDLGGCTNDASCSSVAGCQNGICTCNDGACQPRTGCTTDSQCGTGNLCTAGGVCQAARTCASQDTCTPYGLVCEGGRCMTADPCTGGVCPTGQTCNTSMTPASCFPTGTNQCVRDDQCPAGQYCELFSGSCRTGCRTNTDCTGQCSGAATCNCTSAHACGTGGTGTPGGTCTDDAQCGANMICAINDPEAGLLCDLMPTEGCDKSCRVVCDMLMESVMPTCPAGTTCGGGDGDSTGLIMQLLLGLVGGGDITSGTVSACY